MLEKIGKYCCSILVFIINILLVLLGYQVIKNNDQNNSSVKENVNTNVQGLNQEILNAQNEIVVDRENKLRDQNSAPKEIKQNQTTTQTTTRSSATTKTS